LIVGIWDYILNSAAAAEAKRRNEANPAAPRGTHVQTALRRMGFSFALEDCVWTVQSTTSPQKARAM